MAAWTASGVPLVTLAIASWLSVAGAGPALQTGGLVALYEWPEDVVNLVRNPSFEEVDASGRAVGWQVGEPLHFGVSGQVARTGARSAHLRDSHLARYYPLMTQALPLAPGWYNLRGWVRTHAAGMNGAGAGGRIGIFWGKGAVTGPVLRGTTDWTPVERSFLVPPGQSPVLRLEAYQKPDGSVFFDDLEVRRQVPPVVEGFLRFPNYRGVLFEDRPRPIRMSVTVRPEEARLRLSDLLIRLSVVRDGDATPVASVETPPPNPTFPMTVDAGALRPGSYLLRLQALRRDTESLVFEYPPHRIVKLPASFRKALGVVVDDDHVLVLGGRRRFVLGIYDTTGYSASPQSYASRLAELAEAPLDVYVNYWMGAAPVPALEALLAALRHHGMWYLHTVNSWYRDHPHWPGRTPCGGAAASALGPARFTACMARALAGQPGLAGWYTADEAPADQVPRVFQQARLLQAHAPGGVTFIAQDRPPELDRWRDAADVIGVDPYPIFNVPEGATSPLERVAEWVEQAQASVEGSRPVWAVIQFFPFGAKGHWPTYDELRTMSYMAIVAGAKGLLYWSYGAKGLAWVRDPAQRSELWRRLVKLTKEIRSLEPALLGPDAPEILAGVSPAGPIRVLAKRVGDVRYLIAVNHTPREVEAVLRLAEPAAAVEVIGEGRTVEVRSLASMGDRFGPYATHVYRIAGPPA